MVSHNISEMIGKTISNITNLEDEILTFTDTENTQYIFEHDQDCCEHVRIEEIIGDLDDLKGSPIIRAEERSNCTETGFPESTTWTFYEFATNKGSVTIRWLGESNGYYSEDVDFKIKRVANVA